MWPKFLSSRRRRAVFNQGDLYGDDFHTPRQSLENVGPNAEDLELEQALANQRELAKKRPWLGGVVFGILIVLAFVGWWLAFISLAIADTDCGDVSKDCGYFSRWGLSYFSLVSQIVWLAVLLYMVLSRNIAAYREMMTCFYSIVLINGLMLASSMGLASAQGGSQSGTMSTMQAGFSILDLLNVLVLFMISITPNSALGMLSLDSIPLPWSNRKKAKKKGAVA